MKLANGIARPCLKTTIANKAQTLFSDHTVAPNPIAQAHHTWAKVSPLMEAIMGELIHRQWFRPLRPLMATDSCLILKAPALFARQWIVTHYQELLDVLVSTVTPGMIVFVVCDEDFGPGEQPLAMGKSEDDELSCRPRELFAMAMGV